MHINLTTKEKQILKLIELAKDENIITEYREYDTHITCKLDDIAYNIYIGEKSATVDSDVGSHPNAERAIRASRFVTRLMDKIKRDYSCYYVQYKTSHPDASLLKEKLFAGRTDITIEGTPKEVNLGENWVFSNFEIEIEIVAAIGNCYQRIVDYLTVDIGENDHIAKYNYRHMPIDSSRLLDSTAFERSSKEMATAKKKADIILDFILKGKLQDQNGNESIRKENIKKMLEALTASSESQFAKFLEQAASENGGKVGQISVKPSALLIGADDDKQYVYKVKCHNDTAELALFWRSSEGELHESTQLYHCLKYIESKDAYEFIGLTNVPNDYPIYDFNSLVLAYRVDDNNNITHIGWTINKELLKSSSNSEKEISIENYAIEVKRAHTTNYYYNDCVLKIDGENRLRGDCKECSITGELHFKDDLSKNHFWKGQDIEFGDIYIKDASVSHLQCNICSKTIYFSSQNGPRFKSSYALLDGKICCGTCASSVVLNKIKYQKTANVYFNAKNGTVYAAVDTDGFLPVEKGGNVFKCANCGKSILYSQGTSKEDNTCKICNSRICSQCALKLAPGRNIFQHINSINNAYYVINKRITACASCESSDIRSSTGEKLRLFKVKIDKDTENLVLDDAERPAYVFHCAVCGEPKYYDSTNQQKYRRCAACGRIICSSCVKDYKNDKNDADFDLIFCPACAQRCDDKYESRKKAAKASADKYREYNAKITQYSDIGEITDFLLNDVIENSRKYLPYMHSKDRKYFRKILKNGNYERNITVTIKSFSILEKKKTYNFIVKIRKGHSYLFYNVNGKVTYGGLIHV